MHTHTDDGGHLAVDHGLCLASLTLVKLLPNTRNHLETRAQGESDFLTDQLLLDEY
jgi:hypothetical protein